MGRTKCYQRDEVVGRALELFREQGYAGTSVEDLIKATGINRYSFYDDFGDKRGLFLEVLALFQSERTREAESILSRPGLKMPLFRLYLETIRENGQRNGPRNCLVTSSAVNLANSDADVAAQIFSHFESLEAIVENALREARDAGEIEPKIGLLPIARAFISSARGMRIIAQFEGLDRTVADIIEATLTLLCPTACISERAF